MNARRIKLPKAASADECTVLEDLPNIGPAIAADLRRIGVRTPRELKNRDAFVLYQKLNAAPGTRHDPCGLESFLADHWYAGGESFSRSAGAAGEIPDVRQR